MQSLFGGPILSPELSFVLAGLSALMVSWIAIPVIVRVAYDKGIVDKPNQRTSHKGAVPVLGGVAIFAGLILGSSVFIPESDLNALRYILGGVIILFFTGQKDDVESLSPVNKFLAQLLAAFFVVVLADIRIQSVHGFAGYHDIPDWLSIVISFFLVILIVNAFNLIDGIDGLSSGVGILVSGFFGLWLYGMGYYSQAILASALIGGLIPFFYFNVFGKKNKLFMGDSGSLLVGYMVSIFVLRACGKELPVDHFLHMKAAPAVAIGILIYPLFDLGRVFFLRIVKGRSPFHPDRNHIHHLFIDGGTSHRRSTFYILLFSLFGAVLSWFLRNIEIWILALILLVYAEIVVGLLWLRVRRRNKTSQ